MENVFDKWKIEECIGEGAFGKVYRIAREEFGHKYYSAMKVLHIPQSEAEVNSVRNEGMTEANLTQYFESMVTNIIEEFTLMEKLKGNSYIVSCEDHEVVKRTTSFGWDIYIRMELLTPLFKYVNEKGFSVLDVVHLGIDICRALEICQKYNIIHRDIKPENIFVSDVGDFKLGDFGIARELDKTSGGLSKKGTRNYMAPEVYKGEAYNSTIDIYSLGIVMYRFLNGNRLPFLPLPPNPILYSDKEYAEMSRMSGQPMPAPIDAPPELAKAVLKACAYLPAERYATAKEMRKDLERILYLLDDEDEIEENDFSKEEQMPSYSDTQSQDSLMTSDSMLNSSSMPMSSNYSQEMMTAGNMSNMSMSGNFGNGETSSGNMSNMSMSGNFGNVTSSTESMSMSGNFGNSIMHNSGMSQSDNYEGTVQLGSTSNLSQSDEYEGTVQLGASPKMSQPDEFEGTVQLGATPKMSQPDEFEGTVQLGASPKMSQPDEFEGTVQLGAAPKMSQPDEFEGTVQLGATPKMSQPDEFEGTVQLGAIPKMSQPDEFEGTVQLGSTSRIGNCDGTVKNENPVNTPNLESEAGAFDSTSKITDLENNLSFYENNDAKKAESNNIVKILIALGIVAGIAIFIVLAIVLSKPKQKDSDTNVTPTAVTETEKPVVTETPTETPTEEPTKEPVVTATPTKKPSAKPRKTPSPKPTNKPKPKATVRPTKRAVVTQRPRRPSPTKDNSSPWDENDGPF